MKLPEGVQVCIGPKTYVGEVPDDVAAAAGLTDKVIAATEPTEEKVTDGDD